MCWSLLGWAWASPTLIVTMAPARWIMVCLHVSFILCLFHPGSRDPCTPWNTPCIHVYWHARVHDLQLHALNWTARTIGATWVFRKNYRRRQVGECTDTWYKQIQSAETVDWSCNYSATCRCGTCVNQKRLMDWLYCCFAPMWIRNDQWVDCTAVLWRSYWHRHDTELPMDAEQTSLALLAM